MISILVKNQFNLIDITVLLFSLVASLKEEFVFLGLILMAWPFVDHVLSKFVTEPSIESYFEEFK